jgi:hypothetical protein
MIHSRLLFINAIVLLLFIACNKEEENVEPATLNPVGTWTGTYGNGSANDILDWEFDLLPNGDFSLTTGIHTGNGIWSIQNTTFKAIYSFSENETYNLKGTFNSSDSTITGNWHNGVNSDDIAGGFIVKKD